MQTVSDCVRGIAIILLLHIYQRHSIHLYHYKCFICMMNARRKIQNFTLLKTAMSDCLWRPRINNFTFKIPNQPKDLFSAIWLCLHNVHRASCLHAWCTIEPFFELLLNKCETFFVVVFLGGECQWRLNSIRNRFNNVYRRGLTRTHTHNVHDVRLFIRFVVFHIISIHSTKVNTIFILVLFFIFPQTHTHAELFVSLPLWNTKTNNEHAKCESITLILLQCKWCYAFRFFIFQY